MDKKKLYLIYNPIDSIDIMFQLHYQIKKYNKWNYQEQISVNFKCQSKYTKDFIQTMYHYLPKGHNQL